MKNVWMTLILLTGWLHGAEMTMAEFRLQQRHLALAEFKSLYKQRHYYQHRSALMRHHRRVKKVADNSILVRANTSGTEDQDAVSVMEVAESHLMDSSETNLKIKANFDMEHLDTLLPEAESGTDIPAVSDPSGEDGMTHPQNGDSGLTPQTEPGGGDVPVPDNPVDPGGYDPMSQTEAAQTADSESGNTVQSGTGESVSATDVPVTETTSVTETTAATDAVAPTDTVSTTETVGTTGTADSVTETVLPADGMEDGIRTRFADPWRRR